MKAQFKYSFLAGLYVRGPVFAVIFLMNITFITLGSLGVLPFAAHVTAVSLAGTAIAVMMAVNIIGDISIGRQMFGSPRAYLFALTPVPRWKTLLAGIITMTVMDLVSMTIAIVSVVWLSINLAGGNAMQNIITGVAEFEPYILNSLIWSILMFIAVYILILNIIMFCSAAERSFLFNAPARGLLSFILFITCLYVLSILQLIFIPLGVVNSYRLFVMITLSTTAAKYIYLLLMLLAAGGFFVITSKLMEKRINL